MVRLHRPTLPSLSLLYYHPHSNDRPPNRATLHLSLSLSLTPSRLASISLRLSSFRPMRVLSFFLLILFLVSPSSSLVFFVLRRTGVGYVGHPLSLSFLFLSPLIRFYDACTADSMPTESVRTKNQMLIRLLKIPVIHEISFRSFDPFRFNFILSNFSRGIFYIYIYIWPISYRIRFTLLD